MADNKGLNGHDFWLSMLPVTTSMHHRGKHGDFIGQFMEM